MSNSTVSVPDHCLFIYLVRIIPFSVDVTQNDDETCSKASVSYFARDTSA